MVKVSILAVVAGSLILVGCGPQAAQPGTPQFFWEGAKGTFAAGDYMKTNEHLTSLLRSTNEFTARATPWQLIVEGGLSRAYIELADIYEKGSRATKANSTPFHRRMNEYRSTANQLTLDFAERFQKFESANKDANFPLDFPFPSGAAAIPAVLENVSNGLLPPAAAADDAERKTLERNMVLAACDAAGSPNDAAKAREFFKAGNVQVPRATFMKAMAVSLEKMSELYTRAKLSQPDHVKFLCDHAMSALKDVPDSDDVKVLKIKIEDIQSERETSGRRR